MAKKNGTVSNSWCNVGRQALEAMDLGDVAVLVESFCSHTAMDGSLTDVSGRGAACGAVV